MSRYTFLASLAVLSFVLVAKADDFRNEAHQLEAKFPGAIEKVNKDIGDNGKLLMAYSKVEDHTLMVGVAITEGEELGPEHMTEFGKAFTESMMKARKNASLVKEEEQKLSDNAPRGYGFVFKHETGWSFVWVTIESSKGYFVVIEGSTERSLKSEIAAKFQKSVKITGVK